MPAAEPEVAPVWGESVSASPDLVRPSDGFIQSGWPLTTIPPSRGYFNWILKYAANAVTYLMELGVPNWQSGRAYAAGAVVRADGALYMATGRPTTGTWPPGDRASWLLLFDRAGYQSSRASRWIEDWDGGDTLSATGTASFDRLATKTWTANVVKTAFVGSTGVAAYPITHSGVPSTKRSNVLALISILADSGDHAILTKTATTLFASNLYQAIDFDVWLDQADSASLNFFGGLGQGQPDAGALVGAIFKTDGSGRWKVVTGDGTNVHVIDSGISLTIGGWTRLRVELVGSAVNPDTAAAQAKFYIGHGGAPIVTTSNLPSTSQSVGVQFGIRKVVSDLDGQSVFIGPAQFGQNY